MSPRRFSRLGTTLLAGLLTAFAPIPADARPETDPALAKVIERIEAANRDLTSWSASYKQRRHYVHFDHSETRLGKMVFKRGVGFRIDATEPQEVVVVRAGKAQ